VTVKWRPWHGQPRAQDRVCAGAILAGVLYGVAMIPVTPVLIATHPLLLELLSGSNTSIVAAGSFCAARSKLAFAGAIAAPLPGMLKSNCVTWWAGRLWGPRVAERLASHSPRTAAITAKVHRRGLRLARLAVLLSSFVPVSGTPVYVAAGWVGLPLSTFVILDVIGCAVWSAVLTTCGYLLGSWGVAMAGLMSRYGAASAGVLTAVALAPYVWHARRRLGANLPVRLLRRQLNHWSREEQMTGSTPRAAVSTRRARLTFPAHPRHLGRARGILKLLLDGSPVTDDVLICLSEVAADSLMRSGSSDHTGVSVRAELYDDDRARVEIESAAGPRAALTQADAEPGLGMRVIGQLARSWGIRWDTDSTRTVWFEIAANHERAA
jgi:membrane protein DedA with SNARE-associated domain